MKETAFFYHTQAWENCRESFLKSKRGLCEMCLKEGIITPARVVHHRKPITPDNVNDPAITLNFDNLMALCQDHHAFVHGSLYDPTTGKSKRRYSFDDAGRLIMHGE